MTQFYNANTALKAAGVKISFTPEQVQEYVKCANDPIYFIENYCKIVSLDDGVVSFKPFPYQKRIIDALHHNKKVIGRLFRQSGKSTIISGYITWYVLFNENKTAAILANKQAIAKEIFLRVQFMFENLPQWLQQGVIEWNKTSFTLENGSRCISAATSASAIRGMSINFLLCVEGNTEITLRNKNTGEIKTVKISELEEYKCINKIYANSSNNNDILYCLQDNK
jgi:phage terminase large subunit-like protein